MHKAKNIYFLLIKKKTRWPKAGYLPLPTPIMMKLCVHSLMSSKTSTYD